MRTTKKQPITSPTQKRSKHEQHKRKPRPLYAYNQAYGRNHQTYNEPPEKTPQVAVEAAVEAEAAAAAGEEIPPQQQDHPQATPEEGTTDFLDNPQTYSQGTARRQKSSSRNGNSTTT